MEPQRTLSDVKNSDNVYFLNNDHLKVTNTNQEMKEGIKAPWHNTHGELHLSIKKNEIKSFSRKLMEVDLAIVGKIDRFRKISYFISSYVDSRLMHTSHVNSRGGA